MAREALTHSQSLRVIGQRLHGLHVHAFELSKKGDEYVVRLAPSPAAGKAATAKIASDGVSRNHFDDHPGEVPLSFTFTPAELLCYDEAEGLTRIKPRALPKIGHLSVALRVLGGYLDRRAADQFTICWSTDSVKVCYGDEKQILFSAQNLYDLGIVMCLRSSNRALVKVCRAGGETRCALRQSHT